MPCKWFIQLILQGEIGRRSAGDNVLEREGYAVSAGFSLGLVALGMGCEIRTQYQLNTVQCWP